MILLLLLILIVTIGCALYTWNYHYWKRRGVPGPTPIPLFGNIFQSFILKKSPADIYKNIYDSYPNVPFVGVYRGTAPCLLVRDLDLIKEVLVKSFQNFRDNDFHMEKDIDPVMGRNPFFLKGDEWKSARSLLTPCFSSGKMKAVYPLIQDISTRLVEFIARQEDASNGTGLEAKELCTKFTLNNVASCAFGLEGKCFDDPKSEFRDLAHRFLTPSSRASLLIFISLLIPTVQKYIKMKVVKKDVEDQLTDIVTQTLKYRKENNIVRNDFLHIFGQLKDQMDDFTDLDVTSHAAAFFIDGYETSSIAMSFILYQLAKNPKAQAILREEIDRYFDHNGDLSYEALQEMVYLEGVINESLRIDTPFSHAVKMCTKPYTYIYKDKDGLMKCSITIEAGTPVLLPINAVHVDPQYHEEPESFKPERFIGDNKDKLTKFAFLPFGEGPRICIAIMMIAALAVVVLTLLYIYIAWTYGYWQRRKVQGPTPSFPFGNLFKCFICKRAPGEIYKDIYYNYADVPFVGIYKGTAPCLVVRDPDLIRDITVKSFNKFRDNDVHANEKLDPIMSRNAFFMKGERWKATRNSLTPCFTSGKMKAVYPLVQDISSRLVQFIASQDSNVMEAKEMCTKFTINNVAVCAFGLEGKCFVDPNCDFRDLAYKFMTPGSLSALKFSLAFFVPSLQDYLRFHLIHQDVQDRISSMIAQVSKYRKDNNIVRNDFMNFLLQLKEQSDEVTDLDVAAHAAGFFSEGFETTSIVMSFVLYQLANNPEAQAILRQEVDRHFDDDGLSYESLQQMSYLDGVLNETLRIHPPAMTLLKTCTSPYTYCDNEGVPRVDIETGTSIIIPIYALHTDPQYFDEPERFMPDRFVGKNKEKLTNYTFMPFGVGPRICLGQRFGTMQVKAGVAYIIRNYELSVNPKTKTPLEYDPLYIMLSPKGGLWIDFKKIR